MLPLANTSTVNWLSKSSQVGGMVRPPPCDITRESRVTKCASCHWQDAWPKPQLPWPPSSVCPRLTQSSWVQRGA
jgi:hypothetical protein